MFLVFDTETTGLPQRDNAPFSDLENWPRMVQIAWQLHDLEGNLVEYKDYIIRPDGFDIPFRAYSIHGITTEIAEKEGVDIAIVLEEFKKATQKAKYYVGQNIEFDYKILGAEFYRVGQETPLSKMHQVDTMKYGKDYCQIPTSRPGKFKSPRLEELYEKLFGFKFDEAHNAAADVNATAQVFFEMVRREVITYDNLGLKSDFIEAFQKNNPSEIQPFDIVVRQQVSTINKSKRQRSLGEVSEIEIGNYFNFHNHSIYSSLQSSTSISDLIKQAVENNYPAAGIVDLGNMMGAFKFISEIEKSNKDRLTSFEKKVNEGEISKDSEKPQPIIGIVGCEFYLSTRPEQKTFTKDDPDIRTQVVLLAKNKNGYKNLVKLSSLGYVNGFYFGVPRISKEMILHYKDDLIALSSGLAGDIPHTILEYGEKRGEEVFLWWKENFGEDFYVQIQDHDIHQEEYLNDVLMSLADKHGVKILAQNETYYTKSEDAEVQDILVCIKDGEKITTEIGRGFGKRRGLQSKKYYMQNPEQLKQTFQYYPDAFEAYDEFLSKFTPFSLKRDVLLPEFDIPLEFKDEQDLVDGGKRGENAYLRFLTYKGAERRYGEITQEIQERLDFELEVIANTGYPGYFLIVQDFCNEARNMGVWVGPGRGSAAGSAVAYCIGITNVDPIEYNLLFERFLNPERISMPDIDIDFDDEGRDKIIKWVVDKYGKTNVAQIITYSVLGGKSAIKDAGRVLDLPIPETNKIAKLIPDSPGMNIAKSFQKYDKLGPEDKLLVDEMKEILNDKKEPRHEVLTAAKNMEGAIRNTGIHACGVIITPEDISNLVPITIAGKDNELIVSQYDNSVAESAGLLKMDFLGLRTLSIIRDAIKLVEKNHGIKINVDELPLTDEKTYRLFQEGKTIGVFQYESPGMQKYMRELKPTVFADLIAMNALYRPGPIKYIPNFINRKHGIEEIVYDLPETEEHLKETYGITVYQEQVMLLSQKLANFTKGEADTLRKAMGKKLGDVLDQMHPKFIQGGLKNGLDESKLEKIWTDWKAFAEYAFNKSHSTCYALIAYQTAYLKANYPAEYMASVMTHNLNNTKQITMFMEDCKTLGVDVLGPDVNESQYEFSVNEKGQIRFGLGAIKGIGEGPSEAIVKARENGRFTSIFDFFEKVPFSQINKRVVESLVVAGAYDEVDTYHRAQYFAPDTSNKTVIEKLLKYGQGFQDGKNEIENSLFADFADEVQIEQPKIPPTSPWPTMYRLNKEKEIIGIYISAHPLDEFKYQVMFLEGKLGAKEVEKLIEDEIKDIAPLLEVEEGDDPEIELLDEAASVDMLNDLSANKIQPRGKFNFLKLDEIDAYREQSFGPEHFTLFDKLDFKEKKQFNNNLPVYFVCGIVTEFTIKDSPSVAGQKVAFVTLEDYSGSYSFRIGDKELLKLQQKIDLQRFLIFKIRFIMSKDSRVFINIYDVCELREAFDDFAQSLSVIVNVEQFIEEDVIALQEIANASNGTKKIKFILRDKIQNVDLELFSSKVSVEINSELISTLSNNRRFDIFLN